MLLLLLLVAGVTNTLAQDVTIHAKNGSTIASVPEGATDYDTFFKAGGFATWKHNQLNMTLTVSDATILTENGQLSNPANNIFKSNDGNKIQIGKGYKNYPTSYVAISLPNGYRFTGYSITFSKSNETKSNTSSVNFNQTGTSQFGETNSSFDVYKTSNTVTIGGGSKTITRTAKEDGSDMSNVLYFKLQNTSSNTSNRALITLENATFFFTAEADYTPFTPAGDVSGRSAVDIPFSTSSVDFGTIQSRNYDGANRISYSSSNVKDLMANLTLFEKESVKDGTAYDGTTGKIVDYKEGTISSAGDFFVLGRENQEQIYYLETPISVTQPSSNKVNPVGYRIVGAKFDCASTPTESYQEFYITYTESNGTIRYLQNTTTQGGGGNYSYTTLSVTTDVNAAVKWYIDKEGYIRTGNQYLQRGNSGYPNVTNNKNNAIKCEIHGEGIKCRYNNATETFRYASGTFRFQNNTGQAALISKLDSFVELPVSSSISIGSFEVNIYDKTGKKIEKTIEINSTKPKDSFTLGNLNNDAVMIGVKGIGLVKGTLTIQALDPYIDRINIVCQEATQQNGTYVPTGNGMRLSQTFTASDFAVSGGKFHFYVPSSFTLPAMFTFENLYSHYGDESYYGNTGSTYNSRYNFVMSPYWNSNSNLYATSYDPDYTYEEKVYADVVGDHEFQFNNAATVGTSGGDYQEFPFTLARYGGADNFEQLVFTDLSTDNEGTAYLFSCDESRYNISTATATQHRTYAFYKMDITMAKHTYNPVDSWKKVYNTTCYYGDDGKAINKPMWGLEMLTENIGTTAKPEYGYLCVSEIVDAIDNAIGKTNAPESKDQILYIDGSKLLSIVEDSKTVNGVQKHYTYNTLKDGLGANLLVYLPMGTSSSAANYARVLTYQEDAAGNKTPIFQGTGDFVLTDKKPFYAPYDISISAAKEIRYDREVTVAKYGKVTSASIIMPFAISIDEGSEDGSHTNKGDEAWSFKVHQLSEGNCLGGEVVEDQPGYVFFPALTGVSATEANVPYLVKVNENNVPAGENVSFAIKQNGTTIKATTGMDQNEYTFTGQGGSGTYDSKSYTFTNSVGSYSGKQVAKTKNIFYFAKNMFLCSKDYAYDAPINVGPFRGYYATSGVSGAKAYSFDIVFGENPNGTTGIDKVAEHPDLMVVPGYGVITMTSTIEQSVRVHSTSGVLVNNAKMKAGETQTINVPAGVYVINGVKIIVK